MRINEMLAEFETTPDAAAPDTGADAPVDAAAPDPGAAETSLAASADAQVEAPVTPQFDPSEFATQLEAANARTAQLEAFIGQLFQGADNGMGEMSQVFDPSQLQLDPPQLDPFADDFGAQLAAFQQMQNQQLLGQIAGMFQQFAAPFQQQREAETIQSGESNLTDMLADDIARNGEFHPNPDADQRARTMARNRANEIYVELANRHGGHDFVMAQGLGPRVAEQAMTAAATEIRELFKLVSSTAVQVEDNRRAGLATVQGEPGSAAGAVQGPGRFDDPKSVVDYYAGRGQALNAA